MNWVYLWSDLAFLTPTSTYISNVKNPVLKFGKKKEWLWVLMDSLKSYLMKDGGHILSWGLIAKIMKIHVQWTLVKEMNLDIPVLLNTGRSLETVLSLHFSSLSSFSYKINDVRPIYRKRHVPSVNPKLVWAKAHDLHRGSLLGNLICSQN